MIIDNYLDDLVSGVVNEAEREERANHVSSGKLSASNLGAPLQWQVLKAFGVPEPVKDQYTLRKFARGKDVERWYLDKIKSCVVDDQTFVEYKNVVGYIDADVDTKDWQFPSGIIPLEVKSVTKLKFDRITGSGNFKQGQGPDVSHCYQATLYGLAKASKRFAISYINADDYRLRTYILEVEQYAEAVHKIIERYEKQLATGKVPVFVPEEKWQADKKYNRYPDWSDLNEEQLDEKLEAFKTSKV